MTTQWAYDIEVFPNFFSVIFFDVNSKSTPYEVSKGLGLNHPDVRTFAYAPKLGYNDIEALRDFLRDEDVELIGFNNIMFDAPVMDFTITQQPLRNKKIFNFSSGLIATWNGGGYYSYNRTHEWKQIDLFKTMAFDMLGVSLKQCSINLQWWRVQDLPYKYDHAVQADQVQTILDYNLNDVLITTSLYRALHKELNLRRDLSEEYGIDLMSASDSKMANLMLEKIYTTESGVALDSIRHLRTQRDLVWLRECVGKNISFKTKKLQELKREIDNTVVVAENNFSFKEKITFGNCDYEIGVGGLHSVDEAGKFFSTDDYIIQDADVSSYYPYIILNNNIIPAHLNENFIHVLRKITEERIEAKRDGDETKKEGLKITINSIFGKLNSEYFWLQDAKAMLSVTLSGQLYLLMLIEELAINGIMTISANTDGIVCRIPRELIESYYKICERWQETTDFELDYTPYSRYIRTDVNNYITEKPDGETKEKGRYLKEIGLKKGYRYPVVPRALYNYFVNGVGVMDTLKASDYILDFCISQKSGGKFQMELHQDDEITQLQKNNRFYISNDGGKLIKRNTETDSLSGLFVSEELIIINDFDFDKPFSEYDIKYEFYEQEVMKYIDDIENSTFDVEFKSEELSDHPEEPLVAINKKAEIVPAKFRYSTGAYRYHEDEEKIYRGVASINYLTADTGETLFSMGIQIYPRFLDLLVHNEEEIRPKLNSRQLNILMKLGFFSEFGGRKKLLAFYKEFTKGKFRYSAKHKEKTQVVRYKELKRIYDEIPDENFTMWEIIESEQEIIGSVQTRFKDLLPTFSLVEHLDTIWSPKAIMYSLARGTRVMLKVSKKDFKLNPFDVGDIVYGKRFEKKPRMRKTDDGFVEIPDAFDWWLREYEVITDPLENYLAIDKF